MKIASYIDHTTLKPVTTNQDIEQVCREALEYKFLAVCIPPVYVKLVKQKLRRSTVKTATVIGFPLGYSIINSKKIETKQAIKDGCDELDMVINLTALKNHDWLYLEKEISTIIEITRDENKILKVIIETGLLTDEEIFACCKLYSSFNVDFLKTSTGFSEKGASIETVKILRKNLPSTIHVKASGGIRTYNFALKLIEAGADRIGTSSSVAIVKEELGQ